MFNHILYVNFLISTSLEGSYYSFLKMKLVITNAMSLMKLFIFTLLLYYGVIWSSDSSNLPILLPSKSQLKHSQMLLVQLVETAKGVMISLRYWMKILHILFTEPTNCSEVNAGMTDPTNDMSQIFYNKRRAIVSCKYDLGGKQFVYWIY